MKKIILLITLAGGLTSAGAQGFANLDFQSANIPNSTSSGSFVSITDAIPGWTGYLGTDQQTPVLYNALAIGAANLAILGTNYNYPGLLIPGNPYTVVLQAGYDGAPENVSASIAQTALIPTTAESILFTASFPYAAGWQVTIDGQVVPVSQVGTVSSNYGIYVGDVSVFAGQIEELKFTALSDGVPTVNLYLGSISFSSTAVPEPSELALGALGAFLFSFRRWGNSLR